ncbi:hypothetical protein [Pelagibius sp. 7325]|uniref:hypothetical protein n=1 Tax=Pelagibius sp. 7325 TaxID=3131994 RepID=UPI0030ED9AC2
MTMVSIDDRLGETAAAGHGASPGWVERVRALPRAIPRALPLALAGGLAIAALAVGISSGWFAAPADAALSGAGEVTLASSGAGATDAGVSHQACGRIEEIVHTACGYKQHDHDAAGIRQCVAYELKYTMWSAYGCQ